MHGRMTSRFVAIVIARPAVEINYFCWDLIARFLPRDFTGNSFRMRVHEHIFLLSLHDFNDTGTNMNKDDTYVYTYPNLDV